MPNTSVINLDYASVDVPDLDIFYINQQVDISGLEWNV